MMRITTSAPPPSRESDRPANRWFGRLATASALCRLVPAFWVLELAKRLVPLRVLARWAWLPPRAASRQVPRPVIVGRVLRAGAIAGTPDRDCLQRSLLLYRELSKHGDAPVLVVGLRRLDGRTAGHAWVSCAGEVVAEPPADVHAFEPVLRFGRSGTVIPNGPPGLVEARRDV